VDWEDKGRVLVPGDEYDPPEMHDFYYMTPFRYEGFFLSMLCCQYTDPVSELYEAHHPAPDGAERKLGNVEIQLAHSRDGQRWHRPEDRAAVIPCELDSLDDGGLYPAPGPIVKDGETWIYYLSWRWRHQWWHMKELWERDKSVQNVGFGRLAKMPEDHWVSLDAEVGEGWVLTRPHHFGVEYLVNADAEGGAVETELLTPYGEPVPGFTRGECVPVTGNGANQAVRWTSGRNGWELNDQYRGGVCARIYLRNAKLYSYTMVEPDPEGRIAEKRANVRWLEIIKHRSDNWGRSSTESAVGLRAQPGPWEYQLPPWFTEWL